MYYKASLCILAMSTASVLSAPLVSFGESKDTLSKRGMENRACLTVHMDISTGACGWNGEEIANFQTTLGLPYVSIPRTLFEKDFKGTNPNANPICGRKVRLTNMRTGSIMDGMVMDVNYATQHVQSCIGPEGMEHGPSSFDVAYRARDRIGYNPDQHLLDVLEYEFLEQVVPPKEAA